MGFDIIRFKPMKTVVLAMLGALSLAAQNATSTCRNLFEPKTYQDAIVAAPDPRNDGQRLSSATLACTGLANTDA
jgi:hypothetical protein